MVFGVNACVLYWSENSSIICLQKSGIAAHAVSRISQLSAEMIAASDTDDNPFFTLDDNEHQRNDCRRYGLTSPMATHVCGRGLSNCIAQRNCTCSRLVFALTHAVFQINSNRVNYSKKYGTLLTGKFYMYTQEKV